MPKHWNMEDNRDKIEELNEREIEDRGRFKAKPDLDGELCKFVFEMTDELYWLERKYKETRNPVYVWLAVSAANQKYFALKKHTRLPSWVLAYLLRVASEMSLAIRAPKEDGTGDSSSLGDPDHRTPWSTDKLPPLSASDRREAVVEALRLKKGKGSNPLLQAHREYMENRAWAEVQHCASIHGSLNKAAEASKNLTLTSVSDRMRKLRRVRKRGKR